MANNINELIIKENIKRERKYNAIKLPEDLNQHMLPKYVGYYKECYNVEKKLYREFFKIEKHPKMEKHKVYVSSKSNKITLLEKLEQIKKILLELDNLEKYETESHTLQQNDLQKDELETHSLEIDESNKVTLPKYISLKNHKDNSKYYLIYDKKTNVNRHTLKLTYAKSEPLLDNLNDFLSKIKNKFLK